MSTFNELVDSVTLALSGYTGLQDQATYLTGAVSNSVTSIPVADATAISRGLLEIDDELLWVDVADTAANTLTVPPYGRGFRSTTAVAHNSGVRVVSAPSLPRSEVKRAINETILAVHPDLFAVKNSSFTWTNAANTYEVPADVDDVLWVKWQDLTAASDWVDVRRMRLDPNASTTVFPTGQSLTILDPVVAGRTVRVVYQAAPNLLVNGTDDFATVTGLPRSCEDVIRFGAAAKMIAFLDSAHLTGFSAEADLAANMRPTGGAAALSRYLMQNYQMRLAQEAKKLQDQYPVNVRYSN